MGATVDMESHLRGRSDAVRQIYDSLVSAVGRFGPVMQDPKKTSIHLNRKTAFAGITTRRHHVILTVKSDVPIESVRVFRSEQTSVNRWHCEVRLTSVADVDVELINWLERAYALSA